MEEGGGDPIGAEAEEGVGKYGEGEGGMWEAVGEGEVVEEAVGEARVV